MNRKIISCIVERANAYNTSYYVRFYSEQGQVMTVVHDDVVSANVCGDRIVITSMNGMNPGLNGHQYIYDATTYSLLQVLPI